MLAGAKKKKEEIEKKVKLINLKNKEIN